MKSIERNDCVLITGGSSGIGEALAWQYANAHSTYGVALVARRINKLRELQTRLRQAFPEVRIEVEELDVTFYEGIGKTYDLLTSRLGKPFNKYFINAGVHINPRALVGRSHSFARREAPVFETNTLGAIECVNAAIHRAVVEAVPVDLVVISSVAVSVRCPHYATYSASKVALESWLGAIAIPPNVGMTICRPGTIATEMTEDVASYLKQMSSAQFAKRLKEGLEGRSGGSVSSWLRWLAMSNPPIVVTIPRLPWIPLFLLAKFLPNTLVASVLRYAIGGE